MLYPLNIHYELNTVCSYTHFLAMHPLLKQSKSWLENTHSIPQHQFLEYTKSIAYISVFLFLYITADL